MSSSAVLSRRVRRGHEPECASPLEPRRRASGRAAQAAGELILPNSAAEEHAGGTGAGLLKQRSKRYAGEGHPVGNGTDADAGDYLQELTACRKQKRPAEVTSAGPIFEWLRLMVSVDHSTQMGRAIMVLRGVVDSNLPRDSSPWPATGQGCTLRRQECRRSAYS